MPKVLNLNLKKKWFDMIRSGEKTEEYREIKDYWAVRLLYIGDEMEWPCWNEMLDDMRNPSRRHKDIQQLMEFFNVSFKEFDAVRFRNGYNTFSPSFTPPLKEITVKTGNPEWGAEPGKFYFVLKVTTEPNKPTKIISYELVSLPGSVSRYRVVTDIGEMWLSDAAKAHGTTANAICQRARKMKLEGGLLHPDIFKRFRAPNGQPKKKPLVENPRSGINARREDESAQFMGWIERRDQKEKSIAAETRQINVQYEAALKISVRIGSRTYGY